MERRAKGEVVPIPTLPALVTMSGVEVPVAVEEEMTKRGWVPLPIVVEALIDSTPHGVEVPIPV